MCLNHWEFEKISDEINMHADFCTSAAIEAMERESADILYWIGEGKDFVLFLIISHLD